MKLIILIVLVLVLVLIFYKKKSKFALSSTVTKPKTKLEIAKENAQNSVIKQQALLDSANVFKTKAIDNQKSINNLNIPDKTQLVEKANKTVINANNAVTNALASLDTAKKQLEALNKT
jgi:hypothetical protein